MRVNVDPDLVVMAPSLSEAPLATTIEKLLGRASLSRYTYIFFLLFVFIVHCCKYS